MSLKEVKDYSQSLDNLGHLIGIGTDEPDWYDPDDDGFPPDFIESDEEDNYTDDCPQMIDTVSLDKGNKKL